MGEGPTPVIVFAPFSPCGRRVGDEGFVNGFGSWHGWRRAGREGWALDRVSPALRAWASDFSLRGQRKVTKRKATPACSPSCVGFPRFTPLSHGTRRWAIHGPATLARHPASRPGQTGSPRRTRGDQTSQPAVLRAVYVLESLHERSIRFH